MAATAVVCAVAVVLAVAARAQDAGGQTPGVTPSPPAVSATALASPAPAPHAGAPALPVDPAVAAAAVLAVRTEAGDDTYVDTAAVEAIDTVGATSVVTVRALLLRRVRGGWSKPLTVRFAVPVGSAGGDTVAVAPPWRLPPPFASGDRPAWKVIDDAALAQSAADAIAAAGYTSAVDVSVRRAAEQSGVLAAAVTAIAPGDTAARRHELWLTEDAGAVLGMPAVTDIPVPGGQP